MYRSQLDGKIQFKFFVHMNVHVKCSSCVLKISNVHFLSPSLDYRMRCASTDVLVPRDKMNCSGGYANCFFASSPGLPWQHGRRQLGWYISATLRKQFPNLTKQFILSLGIFNADMDSNKNTSGLKL